MKTYRPLLLLLTIVLLTVVLLIIVLLISNCNHRTAVQHSFTVIEVDPESEKETKLSDFFKDFRIVRLATSDSVLIGRISRIIQANDRIYVSDGNALYIFDSEGNFLFAIDKRGQGPKEFIDASQFAIDGENIIILSKNSHKLLVYDKAGNFVSEHTFPYLAQEISPPINHSYVLYCGNEGGENDYKLNIMKDGRTEVQLMPVIAGKSKYLHVFSSYNFFGGKDMVRFFEPFNDTIYTIVNNKIEPSFYIDFKGKNIPLSFFKTEYNDAGEFIMALDSYARGLFQFAENDRIKMFCSSYKNKVKLTFFDAQNNTSQTFASIQDDIYFKSLKIPVFDFNCFADENGIVWHVNASTVTEWRNEHQPAEEFNDIINMIDEDDNPMLFIFNIK